MVSSQMTPIVLGIKRAEGIAGSRQPPTPTSTCPFPRDKDFVDRQIMAELMYRCQPSTRLALTGIGGVGYVQILTTNTRYLETQP